MKNHEIKNASNSKQETIRENIRAFNLYTSSFLKDVKAMKTLYCNFPFE